MYGGDEVGALVLDLGSEYTKAGYAGEDIPKTVFHTAVGQLKGDEMSDSDSKSQYYVGRQQLYRRDNMTIQSPVVNGIIEDWNAVENIWNYTFQHLQVQAQDHPIMMSEPTFTSTADREKMVELMFEKYPIPALFISKSSVLTAFSAGRSTAAVLESGAGHSTVTPVHDGYVLSKGMRRSKWAGNVLDGILEDVLKQKKIDIQPLYCLKKTVNSETNDMSVEKLNFPNTHPSFHRFMCMDVLRDIKETLCRLSESSFDPSSHFPTVTYELPDGNTIEIGNERFQVPEHMFNPHALPDVAPTISDFDSAPFTGLHQLLLSSVESVDVDLRKELYGNVVLSGGNTLFPGLPNRLTKDVGLALPAAHKVKVVGGSSLNDRRFGVWIGGSILASLGTFHQMWFSKAEYEEHGASYLANKCP